MENIHVDTMEMLQIQRRSLHGIRLLAYETMQHRSQICRFKVISVYKVWFMDCLGNCAENKCLLIDGFLRFLLSPTLPVSIYQRRKEVRQTVKQG